MSLSWRFWLSSLVILVLGLSLAAGAAGRKDALQDDDDAPIKATIRSDGSILLGGKAKYFDLAFGSADTGFTSEGPVGIRSVFLGEHVMIKGEGKADLFQEPEPGHSGTLSIGPKGIATGDRRDKGGWWAWYSNLAQRLASAWPARLPGQMQVLLRVKPDGTVSVLEQEAFFPGADALDRIATVQSNPGLLQDFRKDIDEALLKVSKDGSALYPDGSTAKDVLLVASFVADHDLQVSVPDWRIFDGLRQDAGNVRLVRICSVLDCGFLSAQADHLRLLLPEQFRHKFVPDGVKHEYYSRSKTAFYCIDNGSSPTGTDLSVLAPYVQKVFDAYLRMRDYAAAERFSKALASRACISDNDLRRTAKLVAAHLDFLQEQKDAEKLRELAPQ